VPQVDTFSVAAAVTAVLVAAGLLVAHAVNRKLTAFRWWAASFVLLAVALGTATFRMDVPLFWIKGPSWLCFYAAIALIAHRLHREGAARTNPRMQILICGALLLAVIAALAVMDARPDLWALVGPLPTVLFVVWSTVLVLRARAWGYSLALSAGIGAMALRAVWYATDIKRMGPPIGRTLRGALGPQGNLLPGPDLPSLQGGPGPRLGPPPALEQQLTIMLITMAALLGLALVLVLRDLLAAHNRMRERSTTDAMTGLLNRATFDEQAAAVLAEPTAQPAFVVLFDIDHFKRINDTCGHPVGDRVIARLGQLVSGFTMLRSIAGRIGGEEFAVVLCATELPTARLFAEAIRTGFSASDFSEDITWRVTLSAGIAQCREGESLQAVIARADNALYAAKAQGRDQVVAVGVAGEARVSRLRAG
jgi:diguanylate cyclase (GGDEF)-like protein